MKCNAIASNSMELNERHSSCRQRDKVKIFWNQINFKNLDYPSVLLGWIGWARACDGVVMPCSPWHSKYLMGTFENGERCVSTNHTQTIYYKPMVERATTDAHRLWFSSVFFFSLLFLGWVFFSCYVSFSVFFLLCNDQITFLPKKEWERMTVACENTTTKWMRRSD